ncbi:MAG: PDZ domain-containing protein [Saprospiraceae bacterium]
MQSAPFLLLLLALVSCQPKERQLYLSPNGNDQNPGTIDAPLHSLKKAMELVKAAKQERPESAMVILLREGTYYLQETIEITSLHSGTAKAPLQIKAFPGEKVILSGAKALKLDWEQMEGGIYKASLTGSAAFDQLYINGQRQIRARYPNYDPDILVYNGYAADAISPERIQTWRHPATGVLHAMHRAEWGGYHYQIMGVDENGEAILEGGFQNNRQMGMHKAYRMVENIREELDAPKEWFFDQTENTLYYFPETGFDLTNALVEVAILDQLFTLKGTAQNPVHDVVIDGFTFQHTRSTYMQTKEPLLRSDWTICRAGAIFLEGTENIQLVNNHFHELGGNGLFVSNYNRGTDIATNHFEHIGASAICFVGNPEAVRSPSFEYHQWVDYEKLDRIPGPKTNDYPAEARVYDNLIHDIGTIEKQVAGVQISMASDITLSHNTIYNLPRAGINISEGTWGGHMIAYNDVFNTVLETGDHGAFNSWGRDRFWHPNRDSMDKITEREPSLILLDAQKTTIIRNNRFRCDHGWDIDLDDGSSNYHIFNNLCLNGGLKLREGFYRTVENNILVNNSFHPHVWFKESHDVFRKNIVSTWYKPIRVNHWGDEVDYNFFPDSAGLAQSHALGLDQHGAFGNPEFMAPAAGNFSVAEDSPVLKTGFENFPMDQFGVENPTLKALADSPETPILFMEAFQKEKRAIFDFLGAKVRKIKGLGERSAAGLQDEDGVIILELPPGSLAQKQGLFENDVIIALNGQKTANIRQLMESFQGERWKGQINLLIVRSQKEVDLTVHL